MNDNLNLDFVLKLFNLDSNNIDKFFIKHKDSKVIVSIKLTKLNQTCPVCNEITSKIKDYTKKYINHSILNGYNCILEYHARRYQCKYCNKTFYEHNPFTLSGKKISLATVYNVLNDLKSPNETFTSVALRHNISVSTAINIFDSHVNASPKEFSEIICIDEVYAFKSHNSKYVCVFLNYLTKEVIDLIPSRKKVDLVRYLSSIDRNKRLKVKIVSIDMWHTYRDITKTYFPKAICAIDKFHVLQEFSRSLTQVRISAMDSVKNKEKNISNIEDPALRHKWYENDKAYYVFKKFNWLLFKTDDYEKLDINYPKKFNRKLNMYLNFYDILQIMLNSSDDLKEAYNLKLALYDFYALDKPSRDDINTLINLFKNSNIECMNSFANTLINWKQEILNSFIILKINKKDIKVNNALIENRNKVIKTIKRNSNGYTNWDRFRNRCLYSLNDSISFTLYPIDNMKRRP